MTRAPRARLLRASPPARPGISALIATLTIGASLAACSPGYVLRAAWEEARILARRRPIDELLSDPALGPQFRGKLEIVVQARSFAHRRLHLDVGDSFTSYADIGRDTLALVLSASPVDRLVPYTWWFPIVGRVPYKGFFNRAAAERERRKLEAKRYDTYLRTTAAFSTLGWLPDPLLNTVLRQDSVGLVETVIHEVTHNTVFLRGHVEFNESFANFVGSVGAIEFFCDGRHDPALCERARDRWHDSVRLSQFLDALRDELEQLYAQGLPYDSLLPRRRGLLRRAGERFRTAYAPRMRSPGFRRYDPSQLNNASLIARHLYYHRLTLFQSLYEQVGDLAGTIERIAGAVRGADDPWTALEALREAGSAPAIDIGGDPLIY